jgi:hypothetical protein
VGVGSKRKSATKVALLTAAAVCYHPLPSRGVTISEFYINGEIATNPGFTQGVQSVDLLGADPTVNVPVGDYFSFGVSLVISNNPNPASGGA